MARKAYDTWYCEIKSYNRRMPYYVECDCGEVAQKVYLKEYFECSKCKSRYAMRMKKNKKLNLRKEV